MAPSAVTEAVTVVLPVLTADTLRFIHCGHPGVAAGQVTAPSSTPAARVAVSWRDVPIFNVISS